DREELVGVDPDRAGLEAPRYAPGAPVVAGPDSRGEAEDGVVRFLDEVLLVLELQHGEHGTEDLLLAHARPVIEALDDRRRIERALVEKPLASGADAAAFVDAELHIALDGIAVLVRDERAHLRFDVRRIADAQLP